MNSKTMTYARAKMVIWNAETYDKDTVREAALWMLGLLSAPRADILQAASLL